MAGQSPAVKHHFWILFFATPVLIGLAFLIMLVMVGVTIAAAKTDYDTTKGGLNGSPKTKGELDAKTNQVGELEKDRNKLWKQSYDEQSEARVFDWPVSATPAFNALAPKRDVDDKVVSELKFGEKFSQQNRVTVPEVLRETFDRAYADLEKGNPRTGVRGIAPTRFAGGPGVAGTYLNALRTVTTWGTLPLDPEAFWLLLEDYWVQRGLLAPIAKLNADAAEFQDVTPDAAKGGDLKRNLRTRTWDLDLEVETKGAKQFLKGELRNRTARLQPLGVNKSMKVQVWFKEPKRLTELKNSTDQKERKKAESFTDWPTPDVLFEIRGESVPGKGVLTCTPQEFITAGTVAKFARVAQVFDEATVPVRLVNTIELGMLDNRNKAATFEMPKHLDGYEMQPDPSGATSDGGGPGGLGPKPGGSAGLGMSGPSGSPGGSGTEGGGQTPSTPTVPTGKKFGSRKVVLFDNRMRYVKRTDDVRRMPVAVSVVIDNDYTNDLMVAFTNSPLHFQITQTQWARYKGTLPGLGGGTAPIGGGTEGGGGGKLGSADGGGGKLGSPGSPPGVPGVPGLPDSPSGGPGGPSGPGFPGGTTVTSTGALPGEASANLCEFALFGVVSLYEKVPEEKAGENKEGENKEGENKEGENKEGEKKPDPMTKPEEKKSEEKKPEEKKSEEKKPEEKKPDGDKKDPPVTPPTDDGKKDKQPDPTTPGK